MKKGIEIKKRKNGSVRVLKHCGEDTHVKQSAEPACNVNNIMAKARYTGTVPTVEKVMEYGDFSEIQDYHSAQNKLIQAQNSFMKLHADIRSRFDNDAGKLIEFLENPKNRAEAEKLGLVAVKEAIAPEKPQEAAQEAAAETAAQ
jgi:phage internal scaffolding protein